MNRCSIAFIAAASALGVAPGELGAQSLPAIKADASNKVPECATPGRLMAFVFSRNQKIDPRFASVGTAYMRDGETLSLRWDYAFFQMMLETGNLGYMRGNNKPGDVKSAQNNFAGLGATGKGEPGEAFATIEDGVRAHLQHLQMYAGERVESPVAQRTRKVQEWGVLTTWHKGFARPITFTDLAAKWAPGSRAYASDIKAIATSFYEDMCNKPDPRPDLVQEARAGRPAVAEVARQDESRGNELARQAIERARSEGDGSMSTLGAKTIAAKPGNTTAAAPTAGDPPPTVLNETREAPSPAGEAAPASPQPTVQTASAAASVKAPPAKSQPAAAPPATQVAAATTVPKTPPASPAPPAAQASKCRVWTASYGGQKSVIIRAIADQFTNFTVLDVNEGQEGREIDAYIAAYARGGQKLGEFANQNAALDKAFQLCPEG